MEKKAAEKIKITRQRIGHIGGAILITVAAVGVLTTIAVLPGMAQLIAPFIKKKKYSPRQAISHNLRSLEKAGLVKRVTHKSGLVTLSLTTKGRWEAVLRHGIYTPTSQKKWDKMWRVIIFDIPNNKSKLRNELRRGARLYGFRQLQKSVWVYPYECDDFINIVKEHLGISNDVLYMKVKYIENQKHLETEFDL